jgi:hypothetical protein
MSMEHARALAMACQLHSLLGELNDKPECGAGSRIERAWDRMDEIIALLDDADALRFLKGAPVSSKLSILVLAHRYRWLAPSQRPVAFNEKGGSREQRRLIGPTATAATGGPRSEQVVDER